MTELKDSGRHAYSLAFQSNSVVNSLFLHALIWQKLQVSPDHRPLQTTIKFDAFVARLIKAQALSFEAHALPCHPGRPIPSVIELTN